MNTANTIDMDHCLTARPASIPLFNAPYRVTLAAHWSDRQITAEVTIQRETLDGRTRETIAIRMIWSAGLGRDSAKDSLVLALRKGPHREITGTRAFLRAVQVSLAEGAVVL